MPVWYDPRTLAPFIYEIGLTIPKGWPMLRVRGSLWWHPRLHSILTLESIKQGHVSGLIRYATNVTLRMPVSKRLFLDEFRAVPPLVGSYWGVRSRGELILDRLDPLAEVVRVTAVKDMTVFYTVPKCRELHDPRRFRRRTQGRRHRMHLIDLLTRGTPYQVPPVGSAWQDPHGEIVLVTRVRSGWIDFRNPAGGDGRCRIPEFLLSFDQPPPPEHAPSPETPPDPAEGWRHLRN